MLLRRSASRWLAVVCCGLLVVAGTLAANATWHETLMHRGAGVGGVDGHHASGAHSESSVPVADGDCAICAFVHQQVSSGLMVSVRVPVPACIAMDDRAVVSQVGAFREWPEPSGRGPPAGV